MTENLREKMARGAAVTGVIIGFSSPTVAELAAVAGFDFVVIDCEHGAISTESVANMIRAAHSFGIDSIVRVGANSRASIQVALDAGASGIQVPMIETVEDAARIVRFSRYAPEGLRGLAGNRAAFYQPMNGRLTVEANQAVIVIAQIETSAGMDLAAEIAATPGVDVVFVGPTDLSQSLGHPGDLDAPEVVAAVDHIVEANDGGKVMGILARSPQVAADLHDRGFTFFEVAAGSLVLAAFTDFAGGVETRLSRIGGE